MARNLDILQTVGMDKFKFDKYWLRTFWTIELVE